MGSLHNKRVLLGITGGIAAYKSAELCRALQKAGAEVRVVMTEAAREFITPLTLQALSGHRVYTSLLDPEAEAAMGHIELARWADLILVAPASANFLARLRHGEASDLLSTLCLARRGTLAVAPAMNQAMWNEAGTQDNLAALHERDIHIWGPASGEQACGDSGPGRMLEPPELVAAACSVFASGLLDGVRVTITAGPTREAIDPVRYLSNHSSGKMGYALAEAAVDAGARVRLVSGPVSLPAPERLELVQVESAEQMLQACLEDPGEIFVAVAAVADYRVAEPQAQKIKKQDQQLSLTLVPNPDILATVAGLEQRPLCIGFAAETEKLADYARAKLQQKNLDMIFANQAEATFGSDEASIEAFWNSGSAIEQRSLPRASKAQLTRELVALIAERWQQRR